MVSTPQYDTLPHDRVFVSNVHERINCCTVSSYYTTYGNDYSVSADTFMLFYDQGCMIRNLQGHYKANIDSVFWRFSEHTYNDIARQPHGHFTIPDTVVKNNGLSIIVDSTANTDTLSVTICSKEYIYYCGMNTAPKYCSPAIDTIKINPALFQAIKDDKTIAIVIAAFHHTDTTIDGIRCRFVKEYDIEKQVTLQ